MVSGDNIESAGATGVRKLGEPTPVTVNDKYHLGSCTKTMTAALTAMLVKEGLLTWQTTIGELLKGGVHKEFKDVTIEQLLAHVGGFGEECPPEIWAQAWADQGKLSPTKQRQKFVKALLDRKPDYAPGTKTVYSNKLWMAVMWVLPGKNMAIVVTTNSGAANAFETCDKVVAKLLQESDK